MVTPFARTAPRPSAATLFLSPDTIAATCGLSPGELALLAGLSPERADEEPWHPRLQALLAQLVELFARTRAALPHDAGAAFWSGERCFTATRSSLRVRARVAPLKDSIRPAHSWAKPFQAYSVFTVSCESASAAFDEARW